MHGIVKLEVRATDGRVTDVVEQPMRSPLKAFLQIVLMRMGAADVASAKDSGGTDRTLEQADTANMMDALGAAGDDNTGIVVGSGTTAVTISDSKLETQIADGSASGQLDHDAQANPDDVTTFSDKAEFQIVRRFDNNSGGAISIRELGIYAEQECTGAVTGVFCIARDVLPAAVSIANGADCVVTYTFRIIE